MWMAEVRVVIQIESSEVQPMLMRRRRKWCGGHCYSHTVMKRTLAADWSIGIQRWKMVLRRVVKVRLDWPQLSVRY